MPKIREPGTRPVKEQSNTASVDGTMGARERQLANLKPWKPGESGNPLGRTPGSKDAINRAFLTDLHELWVEEGPEILQRVAKTMPVAILSAMVALVPKEMRIDAEQRVYLIRPDPLSPDEWMAKHAPEKVIEHSAMNGEKPH